MKILKTHIQNLRIIYECLDMYKSAEHTAVAEPKTDTKAH